MKKTIKKEFPKVETIGKKAVIISNTDGSRTLIHYNSVIVHREYNGDVLIGKDWDYSVTTGKFRNSFLNEQKAETLKKINSGEYTMLDE